jgi:WD40 repeat protein
MKVMEVLKKRIHFLKRFKKGRTKLKKMARRLIPNPIFWARISKSRVPISYITGNESKLKRPESISFSVSGDLLGVSNSKAHSVSFYPSVDSRMKKYATRPSFTISNAECLHYVHDAALSPCNDYIVTVARDAHALSLFERQGLGDTQGESEPSWTFRGVESGLSFPTGVAIHPSGNCIAVANRKENGITLYRRLGEKGRFESIPFQTISESDLFRLDLASPHGLDFSPDGNFLIVAHKEFLKRRTQNPQGQSAVALYRWKDSSQAELDPIPASVRFYGDSPLHCVSVHPSTRIIAVAVEDAGVDILRCSAEQEKIDLVESYSIFRIGSSVKGVGFTKDGTQIAVASDFNEVSFFETSSS